jgi:hypothetical protein
MYHQVAAVAAVLVEQQLKDLTAEQDLLVAASHTVVEVVVQALSVLMLYQVKAVMVVME